MTRRPRKAYLVAAAALSIIMVASGLGGATTLQQWTGEAKDVFAQDRQAVAEDRYAMAGGCYAIRADNGNYVVRDATGFAAIAASLGDAEPFHFQATDLGRYLLYGEANDFVAASEGALAEAAYTVTRSDQGATIGGLTHEESDAAADEIADSDANTTSGRGEAVVAAATASNLADWKIEGQGPFSVTLPATDQSLGTDSGGKLILGSTAAPFTFELTTGCAGFPEIKVNVDGDVTGSPNVTQEVRGYLEGHLHMMAYEFIGGRSRCGRPWHRFGAEHALVDCPDHEPGGFGAVLEQVLSSAPGPHNTDGWPTFEGWPKPGSLTHEQVYYKWLERAWRGGQRLVVNLLVDNGQLCEVYPYRRKGNTCNEMDGVRLQADRIYQLQDYIDAQSGGPGEGWFRVVEDPFQAREVINSGKLAVVLGIEVSVPLDCGLAEGEPTCTAAQLVERLEQVNKPRAEGGLGVTQMELANKFDNALTGVTGDAGETGIVVNVGNFGETGKFWQLEQCDAGEPSDKKQRSPGEAIPGQTPGRDEIFGTVLDLTGRSGVAPLYPDGPHCNVLALSELGKTMISEMAKRGMVFDPDHMSARARTEAMDFIENEMAKVNGLPYSGLFSSHGWADPTIYRRIYELGGVVTPHAGSAASFIDKWDDHKDWYDTRYYRGIGFGSDMNGFSTQGDARGADAPNKVTYPFTGFGGAEVSAQQSGTKTYDFNTSGVAHYGLYPDWIEDIRRQGGSGAIEDLERGSEAYLQMWERALGIPGDPCRSDVPDLTTTSFDVLTAGMPYADVLWNLGQPSSRLGATFTYCVGEEGTATLEFNQVGQLTAWGLSS